MRIPPDAVIDEAKFTRYLLVPRPWDDKSGYLRQAGFALENWPVALSGAWQMWSMQSRIARTVTEPSIVSKA